MLLRIVELQFDKQGFAWKVRWFSQRLIEENDHGQEQLFGDGLQRLLPLGLCVQRRVDEHGIRTGFIQKFLHGHGQVADHLKPGRLFGIVGYDSFDNLLMRFP